MVFAASAFRGITASATAAKGGNILTPTVPARAGIPAINVRHEPSGFRGAG